MEESSQDKAPGEVVKILVINPNSSKSMTKGLDKIIEDLDIPATTKVTTCTAPSGPYSINNEDDALVSAEICADAFKDDVANYDAFLVACYSVNPLVNMLKPLFPGDKRQTTPVYGIFEASVDASIALLPPPTTEGSVTKYQKFGIVTTGKYWEQVLTDGVLQYLNCKSVAECPRFKAVETTGLNASELHSAPPEEVRSKMMAATRRLVKDGDVDAICLGCAGMAGMDEMVQEACVEELGAERAKQIHIVDGVKAGVVILDRLVREGLAKA